jgi:hypothetical protein
MKCENRDCGSNVNGRCQFEAEGDERPAFCSLNSLVGGKGTFAKTSIEDMRKAGEEAGKALKNIPANAQAQRPEGYADAPCSVCAAVRGLLDGVAQYLENAPNAEFDRRNVEAFVRAIVTLMGETQNSRIGGR